MKPTDAGGNHHSIEGIRRFVLHRDAVDAVAFYAGFSTAHTALQLTQNYTAYTVLQLTQTTTYTALHSPCSDV